MANLYKKRGCNRWYVKYHIFGRRYDFPTRTADRAEAEKIKAFHEAEVEKRRLAAAMSPPMKARVRRLSKGSRPPTTRAWQNIVAEFQGRCAYCRRPFWPDEMIGKDHIVAVSAGGHNGIANLAPVCLSCNTRRSNSELREWMDAVGYDYTAFALAHSAAVAKVGSEPALTYERAKEQALAELRALKAPLPSSPFPAPFSPPPPPR